MRKFLRGFGYIFADRFGRKGKMLHFRDISDLSENAHIDIKKGLLLLDTRFSKTDENHMKMMLDLRSG